MCQYINMIKQAKTYSTFPIFIVGNPRSGTTLFAVLMDRHSDICVPPETHFYDQFLPKYREETHNRTNEQLVKSAFEIDRIKDLGLVYEEVLQHYELHGSRPDDLLISLLTCYAKKRNKKILGEKTPRHIRHVDEIMTAFPHAKIICVMRDGRDSVRSILKAPWGMANKPRRLEDLCVAWSHNAKNCLNFHQKYPNNFTILYYERLLRKPEEEMKRLCDFVNISYEERMLDQNIQSDAVPNWELDWKGKAQRTLDTSRIEAWRKSKNIAQIWTMNIMMGKMLTKHGYRDTNLTNCPMHIKLKLFLIKTYYNSFYYSLTKLLSKIVRSTEFSIMTKK